MEDPHDAFNQAKEVNSQGLGIRFQILLKFSGIYEYR